MSLTGTVNTVGFTPSSETPTPPADFSAVLYIPQTLTAAQKLQALVNIGAVGTVDLDAMVANVEFDAETQQLQITKNDGSAFTYDLSQNQGIADVDFDANNDLQVDFVNGSSKIIPLANLLSNFITEVNGKTGSNITIGVDDIEDLRLELDNRVPTGITIEIDGEVQDLQGNPVFDTNSVKYTAQELTADQQQVVHSNLDIYSKQQVIDAIAVGAAPTEKQIFIHEITEIDLANPAQIILNLETVPNQAEWYDLHINGGFVNDNSYQIHDTQLIIDRTQISYPITTGKKITFRYRRA